MLLEVELNIQHYSTTLHQAFDSLSSRSGSVTIVTPEFCDLWNLLNSDLIACINGVAGSGIMEAGGGGLENKNDSNF